MGNKRTCLEAESSMDGCGSLRQFERVEEWLEDLTLYTDPATLPEGKVLSELFLGVQQEDDRLVGMIQIRHSLNEQLMQFGGHIGYSILPGERRKGYAKEQLQLALDYCRGTLGMEKVLITCLDTNEASRRTILSAGGVYENTARVPGEGLALERYWVTL